MGNSKYEGKSFLGKLWYFIWEDNSIWSWLVNILLAFVLIKFVVYPGLGFVLQTDFPVVAVISGSMDHDTTWAGELCGKMPSDYKDNIDGYWDVCGNWYEQKGIRKEDFKNFGFRNGFNKGDIIILKGKKNIEVGDVLVFWAQNPNVKRDPIIHRVVDVKSVDGNVVYQTKGDHNPDSIGGDVINELEISSGRVIGVGLLRIPLLGYIKIFAVAVLNVFV